MLALETARDVRTFTIPAYTGDAGPHDVPPAASPASKYESGRASLYGTAVSTWEILALYLIKQASDELRYMEAP